MLEWLIGRKRRRELPEYSYLRAVPTRPLPPEVVKEESGELFDSRRMAIEEGLRRGDDNSLQFVSLMTAAGQGVVTIPIPNGGGQCLPVFSSPFRAADYVQTLLSPGPPVR
jgi:hypothetical protein